MNVTGPSAEVGALLRTVFDTYSDASPGDAEYETRLHDFLFHMTDWWEDLSKFGWAMLQPGTPPSDQAKSAVYGFLVHALPHLMAASEALHNEPARHPFTPTPLADVWVNPPQRPRPTGVKK